MKISNKPTDYPFKVLEVRIDTVPKGLQNHI